MATINEVVSQVNEKGIWSGYSDELPQEIAAAEKNEKGSVMYNSDTGETGVSLRKTEEWKERIVFNVSSDIWTATKF